MRARVEICDISDGSTQVVLESDIHVEAPNWAPSGDWLLVNAEGRLFRIPLDASELIPVDTGTCVTCNNDHGISPDGHSIVLSDIDTAGDLTVTALGGSITDDGDGAAGEDIDVGGNTSLSATVDITLDDVSNDFDTVDAAGVNVTLVDRDSIVLSDIDATGNLTVQAITGSIICTASR